jgi:molybdate transport system permease protein
MDTINFTPFILSFKLALITTILLFIVSLPISYFISYSKTKFSSFCESILTLPLILPPTVLGFYLLIFLSNINLAFSFAGLVIASMVYSIPFMSSSLIQGFKSINQNMVYASYLAKKSKLTTFIQIVLPNMKNNIISGFVLTFAHTVGEFGVILMVGGSIPGESKVASIAIYELVEVMDYKMANIYSMILLVFSLSILLITNYLKNKND